MWSNPQETADLVTFTEEVLNGKPHFLCSGRTNELQKPFPEFKDVFRFARFSLVYPSTINGKMIFWTNYSYFEKSHIIYIADNICPTQSRNGFQ